jgi:signal transduction histidine kinase
VNFTSLGITHLKRVHVYETFPSHLIPVYGTWNFTFYIDNILVFVHSFFLLFICRKIDDRNARNFILSVVFASFFIYINGVLSGFLVIPLFFSNLNTVFAAIILFAAYFKLQNSTIKKINQELKDERELLVRTENLKVLGEMAAGIAHEIKNPLTSIKGFVKLIDQNVIKSKEKYYLSIISNEIDRINDVVGELLFIAKPQASIQTRKNVNINKAIQDVKILLDVSGNLFNTSIDIRIKEHIDTVAIEEKQIKQVLINILKNSLEAVSTNGKIRIKSEKIHDNKIRIRVIDNGGGITKARLKRLGEPFYTTKERGTGLGLTVCFKIIRESNGQILFRSKERLGTIVDIILSK